MILTDEEIAGIGQELAAVNNVSDIDFARAIESAVLAKIKAQGAYGYFCDEYMGGPVITYQVQFGNKDDADVFPLYKLPEDACTSNAK